ncbi:MAG: hypothetical protein EA400_01725 [Chromatiaceae bacterium]|nr:MAG: hypothetical protein EA400_01725 [Chromatiaceae bacterium]
MGVRPRLARAGPAARAGPGAPGRGSQARATGQAVPAIRRRPVPRGAPAVADRWCARPRTACPRGDQSWWRQSVVAVDGDRRQGPGVVAHATRRRRTGMQTPGRLPRGGA